MAYMPMAQKSFKYIITKNVIQKMMFLKTKKKGKKKGGGVGKVLDLWGTIRRKR